MIVKDVVVQNKMGLHARPSVMIVKEASKFESMVVLKTHDDKADCKSILEVLLLAAERGTEMKIIAEGADENEAATGIEVLFLKNFHEKNE